ncbi:MlaA family lipoprotein [Lentisphaerota bacterium ZTH]|nr:VacJ family lipoprotein [Lentisphaerota bacterium]WET06098.1 MlaA family lipoprotein [Lentisphaerota bacterium ZTH]
MHTENEEHKSKVVYKYSGAHANIERLNNRDFYIEDESIVIHRLPSGVLQVEIEYLDFATEFGGRDPMEGVNRSLFTVNDYFFRYGFRPLGTFYGSFMPRPAIEGIVRLTDNLAFPKRMFASFAQAKLKSGGIVFLRFMTNTTLGLAGFFDPAYDWFELERQDEDFGQAFASWGIGPGCYLFLPGEGPSNVRDGVGKIFDYAFDPKTYIYGGQATTFLNRATMNYADYDALIRSNADPYQVFKDFWSVRRKLQVDNYSPVTNISRNERNKKDPYSKYKCPAELDNYQRMPEYGSQGEAVDTLRKMVFSVQNQGQSMWVYLSLFNTDFIKMGSVRSLKINEGKDELDYRIWKQKSNPEASLAIVMPGLGGHYSNNTLTAFCEMLHNQGYAVIAMSSSMNWQFMESAATNDAPGYAPQDAADIRMALEKILHDVRHNYGLNPQRTVLTGYSLGGLHTLFISKLEEEDNRLGIDRYLAVNPPVDLYYALRKIEEFYSVYKYMKKEKALNMAAGALGKMLYVMKTRYPWKKEVEPGFDTAEVEISNNPKEAAVKVEVDRRYQLLLNNDEAKLLVGYSFKRTLEEVMMSLHRRGHYTGLKNEYSWGGRAEVYSELSKVDFEYYVSKVMASHYSKRYGRKVTHLQLNKQAHMNNLEGHLAGNPDVRVIHTMDDFLINDEHRVWMKKTLKDKIVFFQHGAHLGNLYIKKVHDKILEFLKESPPISETEKAYYDHVSLNLAEPYNIPTNPARGSEMHNPI